MLRPAFTGLSMTSNVILSKAKDLDVRSPTLSEKNVKFFPKSAPRRSGVSVKTFGDDNPELSSNLENGVLGSVSVAYFRNLINREKKWFGFKVKICFRAALRVESC
jgi:hypothetical protein